MILAHQGKSPRIDPTAYVAPNAVVCGNVTIGPEFRVMFGHLFASEPERKPEACQPLAGGRAQRHPRSTVRINAHREAMPASPR